MDPVSIAFVFLALVLGFLLGWLTTRARSSGMIQRLTTERDLAQGERQRVESALESLRTSLEEAQRLRVEAETSRSGAQKQIEEMTKFVSEARQQLEGTYSKLSQDALSAAIESLLRVVKPHLDGTKGEITSALDSRKTEIDGLLKPVREMLDKYQGELRESEKKRVEGYAGIEQQVRALLEATEATRREASKVATALSNPRVSGAWGEQALKRCVELAGMTAYCDFTTQETFSTEGGRIRPDLIIRLPNERVIAVDSKAPMTAYLEASAETDEKRQKDLLGQHARNLRRHIDQLSSRDYHENIGDSLDLTVLFLGGEQFLYSALMADPTIFEFGAERKVFIATPTVLVPLLRVVAISWKADQTEDNARRALETGRELYERFVKVLGDIEGVGNALATATRKYDEAIRSIDARLIPKARELQSFVSSSKEIPDLGSIDASVSRVTKLAMAEGGGDDEDPGIPGIGS